MIIFKHQRLHLTDKNKQYKQMKGAMLKSVTHMRMIISEFHLTFEKQ